MDNDIKTETSASSIVSSKVRHISFGSGTVTSFDGKYIEVDFSGETGKKTFIYPGCFDAFLSFEDKALQKQATGALGIVRKEEKQRIADEKKQKERDDELEKERIRELCRPKKRAVTPKKK